MRTMIVDDSKTNAELLEAFLLPFGGCDLVSRGEEALERFSEALDHGEPYQLICLDIMMPEMDGHAVLREMRRKEEEAGIDMLERVRIIMTTAADLRENVMRAFKEQCDSYIIKPIMRMELLKHIYRLGLVDADTMVRHLLKIETPR